MASDAPRPKPARKKTKQPARIHSPQDAVCLFESEDEGHHHSVGSGFAWIQSRRSPVKNVNEDSAAIIPINAQSAVFVVADGVGGHSAGEQASRMVVQFLCETITAAIAGEQLIRTAILNGLELANQAVLDLRLGAASTAAVVEVCGSVARTYHVGDSGIVICGGRGKLKLQTIAHAPVSYAVEAGILNEEEAMDHKDRHLVSNVVGSAEMRIEIGPTVNMAPRDTLLLASDGLFDNLYPDEVVEIIRRTPLTSVAKKICQATKARMDGEEQGKPSKADDLSFVLFRQKPTKRKTTAKKKANPLLAHLDTYATEAANPDILPLRPN